MTDSSLRLLVVEDEGLVAMFIEDLLTALGHHVIGPTGTIAQALAALESNDIDGAILDVNLGGGDTSYEIADQLKARGVPFAFVTGYGAAGVDRRFESVPVLQKPFGQPDLQILISETFNKP